eukprot:10975595-Alexandrium_andersonii.AAC.1
MERSKRDTSRTDTRKRLARATERSPRSKRSAEVHTKAARGRALMRARGARLHAARAAPGGLRAERCG